MGSGRSFELEGKIFHQMVQHLPFWPAEPGSLPLQDPNNVAVGQLANKRALGQAPQSVAIGYGRQQVFWIAIVLNQFIPSMGRQ